MNLRADEQRAHEGVVAKMHTDEEIVYKIGEEKWLNSFKFTAKNSEKAKFKC